MKPDYLEVRENDEACKADVDSGIYTQHYELKPTDVVLDLGAHVGNFTRYAAARCKQVIAFEPEYYNFQKLRDNTQDLPNVHCLNAAAGCDTESRFLHVSQHNSGGHSLHWFTGTTVHRVNVFDIGLWLLTHQVQPDFAKIDTEGSEAEILIGLFRQGFRFPMAIEIHSETLWTLCASLLSDNAFKLIPSGPFVGVCHALPLSLCNSPSAT